MLDFYLHTLKNAFNFSGRARRKEYLIFEIGTFILFCVLIPSIFSFSQGLSDEEARMLLLFISLALLIVLKFIFGVAVAIRRLHDVGKSGWFLLLNLLNLIPVVNVVVTLYLVYLTCIKKGDIGDNQYGPDPKHED
jgi:uncharacterized membrane protein YhaH (DUF805 family)